MPSRQRARFGPAALWFYQLGAGLHLLRSNLQETSDKTNRVLHLALTCEGLDYYNPRARAGLMGNWLVGMMLAPRLNS